MKISSATIDLLHTDRETDRQTDKATVIKTVKPLCGTCRRTGEAGVYLHSFVISAVYGGEKSS